MNIMAVLIKHTRACGLCDTLNKGVCNYLCKHHEVCLAFRNHAHTAILAEFVKGLPEIPKNLADWMPMPPIKLTDDQICRLLLETYKAKIKTSLSACNAQAGLQHPARGKQERSK